MSVAAKRALLIGNSQFADERLARLFAPAEDVHALRAVLADSVIGGFDQVDILLDHSLQPVRRAIANLCRSTEPNDLVLLYYTGHGILTLDNDFYLALGETTMDCPEADGLEAGWLRARLDRCRARRQVLILDCCHSGAFMTGRKSGSSAGGAAAWFTQGGGTPGAHTGLGRYVLTASDAQSFAWDALALKEGPPDTDGRTSLFTRLLVQGLASGEAAPDKDVVSIRDLYDYVFQNLPAEAPAMSPRFFVDGGVGELILARNAARLPQKVVDGLNNADPDARLDAVDQLDKLLRQHRLEAARRDVQERSAVKLLEQHAPREADDRVRKRIEVTLAFVSPRAARFDETKRTGPGPAEGTGLADFQVFRDRDEPWCPELVAIPAGEFQMGAPRYGEGYHESEWPQHLVRIASRFAIGRYPVTFEEYDRFCAETKRAMPSDEGWGRGRRPVINVAWLDARAYVTWLATETGKPCRLPSEAEWEYACRAGSQTRYAWGDDLTPKYANYRTSNQKRTTEVGSYPANGWGLFDMHGNVWEWNEDIWHEGYKIEDLWNDGYKDAPDDGAPWTDGEGDNSPHPRVIRGGSWGNDPWALRSASRFRADADDRVFTLGFRVARSID
jgi:formylglycine-generating enzyme required for sulfatase activity